MEYTKKEKKRQPLKKENTTMMNQTSNILKELPNCIANNNPNKSSAENESLNIINELQKLVKENLTATLNCQYYDEEKFNNITHRNPKLTLFHINIRSLNANRRELQSLLSQLNTKFDVIAMSEIGNTNIEENIITFNMYEKYYQRSETKCGGSAILIKNNITVIRERIDLKFKENENYQVESTWIECTSPTQKRTFIIGVIYKHPTGSIQHFNMEMEKTIDLITKETNSVSSAVTSMLTC
jgi:uncharacterized protein YlxP (DUF503 family)